MNKIALSFIALAALSTASFAERNYDLRDLQTVNGQSSSGVFLSSGTTDVAAAAIVGTDDGIVSAYARQLMNAEDGDNGEN